MVAFPHKRKKKQPKQLRKYNEQADDSLPLYVITGLDNELSPLEAVPIQMLHFRDDRGAIAFSKAYAKEQDWHKWEVFCGNRGVYHRNLWTNEEWPK